MQPAIMARVLPMTMMDADISDARPARSPDTKAAIEYVIASGAAAITIAEHDGVCFDAVRHPRMHRSGNLRPR
jgi:hypothetical protein